MQDIFHGVVLFSQTHKETDAMVKLFTLEYGKQMFFVRHLHKGNHPLKIALLPFSQAEFIGQINRTGLSFLKEYRDMHYAKMVQKDIRTHAIASYLVGLADAVVDDRIKKPDVYYLLSDALDAIERQLDPDMVAVMYELHLLKHFGVDLILEACVLTAETVGPFDYSMQFGGLISRSQWDKDSHRLHINPNAIFILQKMKRAQFRKLTQLTVPTDIKQELRRLMDTLYEEYVGIRIKSKQFLDNMSTWYSSDLIE